MLVFTIWDILIIAMVVVFLFGLIVKAIIDEIRKIGKKNCYDCKHYDLYDVTSVGGYCRMQCTKCKRIDPTVEFGENEHYVKCKDFEEETDDYHQGV